MSGRHAANFIGRTRSPRADETWMAAIPTVVNTDGTSESIGFASAAVLDNGCAIPDQNGTVTIGRGSVGPWRTEIVDSSDRSMLAIRTPYLPEAYLFGQASGGYPADPVMSGQTSTSTGGSWLRKAVGLAVSP